MLKSYSATLLFCLASAAALPLVGCGDGGDTTECGDGTMLQDGLCVPTSTTECGDGTMLQDGLCVPTSTTECGEGTVLTNNQCVPDGSLICDQGTIYDMVSGQCVVDSSACANGTVLIGSECVADDDTLVADLNEAAEPNDATGAGQFPVPAIDAMTSIHGCISPSSGVADQDVWFMEATGPALVEITADGVGGLAAGFIVQAFENPALPEFLRFGVNLTGDTSRRQVYLPVAGTYLLVMDDSRSIIVGEAAGSTDTCYYTTIKQIPLPAATPVTLPQTLGTDSGQVMLLASPSFTVGDIFDVLFATASPSLRGAFIVRKNGGFYAAAAFNDGNGRQPFFTAGGLESTDQIELIVDNVYNISVSPQPYTLDLSKIGATALPVDGSGATLTKHNGENPTAPYRDRNYLYFDVGAGEILHFDLTASVALSMLIVRSDIFDTSGSFSTLASLAIRSSFSGQFVRFAKAGRYYLVTLHAAGLANETYTINSTLAAITPSPVSYGTALADQALAAYGSGFHTLDITSQDWIEFGVTTSDWGVPTNNARVSLYDLAGEGWLASSSGSPGANYPRVQTDTQAADGTAPGGRIVIGDNRDYLIRIENTGTPGTSPKYDLLIADRPHINLGTIAPGAPVVRTNTDTTAVGATTRYLALGTAGHRLTAQVTPTDATADIAVHRRTAEDLVASPLGTFDAGGPGAAETLSAIFPATPDWIAFSVTNKGAATTNITLNADAIAPIPFVDICASGTILAAPFDGSADDAFTPVQTLPGGFSFNFFGVPQSAFIVGANGILSFGSTNPTCSFGCYSNSAIPSNNQPNGFVAGYWDDLEHIQVCRKDEASKVTIQWSGDLYGSSTALVQFQVVLNTDGRIDMIYGPNHEATGSSATVGVEDATGTVGTQLVRDVTGSVTPNSSYSITTP